MKRYLINSIKTDLKKKMVIVGGARQVGKTTMAISLLTKGHEEHPAYINWDIWSKKDLLIKGLIPSEQKLIILDEIHKYKEWRNLLKGLFDQYRNKISFLITGSARLDYYSKGGDSLLGRYHYYRLHPFSLRELNKNPNKNDLNLLMKFGGFPEPLLNGDEKTLRRWQKERIKRVIHEDLRDLEQVKEISYIDILVSLLPSHVASPISINALREDVSVSHDSITKWIKILNNLYMTFEISPYSKDLKRSIKKEKKIYFWDWSIIEDIGKKFENLVAAQLLKYCNLLEDSEGFQTELNYIRDRDGREIDFVVLKDRKPEFAVECKISDKNLSKHIKYFSERIRVKRFYQVHMGLKDYIDRSTGCRVLPFEKFCDLLKLP